MERSISAIDLSSQPASLSNDFYRKVFDVFSSSDAVILLLESSFLSEETFARSPQDWVDKLCRILGQIVTEYRNIETQKNYPMFSALRKMLIKTIEFGLDPRFIRRDSVLIKTLLQIYRNVQQAYVHSRFAIQNAKIQAYCDQSVESLAQFMQSMEQIYASKENLGIIFLEKTYHKWSAQIHDGLEEGSDKADALFIPEETRPVSRAIRRQAILPRDLIAWSDHLKEDYLEILNSLKTDLDQYKARVARFTQKVQKLGEHASKIAQWSQEFVLLEHSRAWTFSALEKGIFSLAKQNKELCALYAALVSDQQYVSELFAVMQSLQERFQSTQERIQNSYVYAQSPSEADSLKLRLGAWMEVLLVHAEADSEFKTFFFQESIEDYYAASSAELATKIFSQLEVWSTDSIAQIEFVVRLLKEYCPERQFPRFAEDLDTKICDIRAKHIAQGASRRTIQYASSGTSSQHTQRPSTRGRDVLLPSIPGAPVETPIQQERKQPKTQKSVWS